MDGTLWLFLPLFVAAGSGLLAFYIMQARMEVAVSRERELLAETRAQLQAQERTVEDRVKAAEEAAQRKSLETFLADLRVEERHYIRESKSRLASRKSMVLQERLFFRNIPLSNWIEHEMVVDETGDTASVARLGSVFSGRELGDFQGPNEQVPLLQ
jgi:flagellar biosynthesis regulator FlaF